MTLMSGPRSLANPLAVFPALLLALLLPSPGSATPLLREERQSLIVIRPLSGREISPPPPGGHLLAIAPHTPAQVVIDLAWPDAQSRTRVTLRGGVIRPHGESSQGVEIEAHVERGQSPVRIVRRQLEVHAETGTALMEVARHGDVPLVLALEMSLVVATVVRQPRAAHPVVLRLEIQRVIDGRSVSLEVNHLATIVGETVSYAFRIDGTDGAAALSIELTPQRLDSGVAEITVAIEGSLPTAEQALYVARRERWFVSRDAASTLSVEAGDPPNGYRFVVTPSF